MSEITIFVAVLAGIGSFFAPCILPMIPAFLAYISGTTISDLTRSETTQAVSINKTNVILNTIFFVLGFSLVFSALGVAINSVYTSSANELISSFNQIGGMFGFFFTDEFPNNFDDVSASSDKNFESFFKDCLNQGIYFAPSKYEAGFISTKHTKKILDEVINKVKVIYGT